MVAAAFAGAPAVILPSNARADQGAEAAGPIAAVAEATGIDVALPTGGDPSAAADAAVATVLGSGVPDGEPDDAAGVTEPATETTDRPAPAMESPDGATPGAEPVSAADTSRSAVDTTPDTVASQPAPTTSPVAVQVAPTNVNVNVRIASAGDNGPVTQTNVAATASTAAGAVAPKPVATASTASPVASPTDSGTPARATAPTAAAQDDAGTWSWQWDCVSVPAISMISPGGSRADPAPRNWTWIWNCGDNSGQYQGATVEQYQPSNVNVSIRIASPGNDGPVSQANVAFAVSAGESVPHGASTATASDRPATPPIPVPVPVVALPAIPGMSALPGLPAVLSPVVPSLPPASLESGVAGLVGPEAAPLLGELDGLTLVAPAVLEPDAVSTLAKGVRPLHTFQQGSSAVPHTSLEEQAVWSGSTSTSGLPATESAQRAAKVPEARAKPAPRWRTPAPRLPAPAQAPPGASAAAAGGGGSSGGGLPFFLALPFVAAVLDLARRAALDRAATPSGHRSRMPDTPG
jgi:hypothetical protein